MWEWSGSAFDEGEEAAKWFSDYLGKQSRLVRFNKGFDSYSFHFATDLNAHSLINFFLDTETETRYISVFLTFTT